MAQVGTFAAVLVGMLAGLTLPAYADGQACDANLEASSRAGQILGAPVDSGRLQIETQRHPVRGWSAVIEFRQSSGRVVQRSLVAESCEAVIEAAAVFVALSTMNLPNAADAARAERPVASTDGGGQREEVARTPGSDLSAPRAAARTAPDDTDVREVQGQAQAQDQLSWAFSSSAVGETGALPGVGLGGSISIALYVEGLRFAVWGSYLGPRENTLPDTPNKGGRFDLAQGGAEACLVHSTASIHWRGCVGASLGSLGAKGFGVDEPEDGRSLLFSARGGVTATLAIDEFLRPFIGVHVSGALERRSYVLEEMGLVHTPSALSGALELGIEVRL